MSDYRFKCCSGCGIVRMAIWTAVDKMQHEKPKWCGDVPVYMELCVPCTKAADEYYAQEALKADGGKQ